MAIPIASSVISFAGGLLIVRIPVNAFLPASRASLLFVLALCLLAPAALASNDRLSFSVRFENKVNPWRVLGIYMMPGQWLDLSVAGGAEGRFVASDPFGNTRAAAGGRDWRWRAPLEPGLYPIRITRLDTQEVMTLNLFVKVPRQEKRNGVLNGYRIGEYPRQPYRGLAAYQPPPGFIEVTPETEGVHVSPHFTLGQFVSKQGGGYPRYVVLREPLLLMLEKLLEEVRAEGVAAATLEIMSGYRTPWYNASIGNGEHSRHIYGGAADVYIDQNPRNGRMDDLTGDGRSDVHDAYWLAGIAERVQARNTVADLTGGIGVYGPRPHRGPFLHVDARGFEARWELP